VMVRYKKAAFIFGLFGAIFGGLLFQAPSLSTFLLSPDPGVQLALGSQVLNDKYPFIDNIFHYGPLVAYTTALGQCVANNLIPEVIICSLGYAVSICFMFFIVRGYGTILSACIVAIFSYLFLARFFKWYYWLFPIAVLYCTSLMQNNTENAKRYSWLVLLTGFVAGTGALYRFDLGMVFLCFFIIYQALVSLNRNSYSVGFWVSLAIFYCGFMLSFGSWLLLLIQQGGIAAIKNYFYAIFSGGYGAVEYWNVAIPPFNYLTPLSESSATAAILILLPVVYLCCLGFGLKGMIDNGLPKQGKSNLFLTAVGIMGLGIYPQGYYRADSMHALQVIPPALLAIPLIFDLHWKNNAGTRPRNIIQRSIIVVIMLWGLMAFLGLLPAGGRDMSRLSFEGFNRLRLLAHPLEPSNDSLQDMMNKVISVTQPDSPILVVPYRPQIYYFTKRPMSGLLIMYVRGIYDDIFWRTKNMQEIRKNKPQIIIAQDGFFTMGKEEIFRASQPELYSYIFTNYRKIIYKNDGWLILCEEK
jgi:hypothetical protein